MLIKVASTDKSTSPREAFEWARKMIEYRYQQLAHWQQYYVEISASHNGVIALQFLQTEVVFDMLESARIYEQTPMKRFRFHASTDSTTMPAVCRHVTLCSVLCLSPLEEEALTRVYLRYEHECQDLFGEDYSSIATYAGEPSDFTPGLAQLMGFNLLEIIRREIKLKEKYLSEMNVAVGPSAAARFLAWEDYYSLVNKMDAWVEAP
jgi:hypothetical protein